jgi:prepilin-type N-terminal cleavage/methylation domain-containing protein
MRALHAVKQNQRAFSLLEALIAIVIFGIASVGMAQAFITHMSFNTASERKTGALAAAQLVLDETRLVDPATLPSTGTASRTVSAANRTYSVVTTYCPSNLSSYCTSTTRGLRVEVNFNGQLQYKVETVFSQLR